MKIVYIADDGTQFDNQWQCEEYEFKNSFKHLNEIKIYNKEGIELSNLFEDDTYNYSKKVVIKTEEAYEEFIKISEYGGWCEFERIPGPGTWIENPEYSGFFNQIQWLKEE